MTQADSFSWELPDDARIVALVHDSAERERSSTVVDAIATSIGRRREHTLVMSTEPGPTPLDELAGAGDSDGWPAFFAERERLTQVAVQRPERPYVYLSAGRDARTVTQFLLDDIFLRFIDRVRERGGTLLLVMCERTPIARDLGKHLDGYVALGDMRRADSDEFDYYGRVRYESADARPGDAPDAVEDAPAADEPVAATAAAAAAAAARAATEEAHALDKDDAAAPEPEVPPRRRAARRGPPLRLVVWVLATAAVLAGGWWLYRNPDVIEGLRSRLGFGDVTAAVPPAGESAPAVLASDGSAGRATEEPSPAATEEPPPAATNPTTAPPPADAATDDAVADGWVANGEAGGGGGVEVEASAARPELDPASAGVAFETATERPYSVLVRSLGDGGDARNHVAELRTAAPGVLYFTAPTPVEDILYHRVFAGALESEADAAALLDVLVRSGATEEANPWQLRRARLAFDLGVFTERSLAEARVAELAARGIAAYSLAASSEGHAIYRVYAGAYEDERAALAMAAMLEAADETAALVPRRGDPTPSTS